MSRYFSSKIGSKTRGMFRAVFLAFVALSLSLAIGCSDDDDDDGGKDDGSGGGSEVTQSVTFTGVTQGGVSYSLKIVEARNLAKRAAVAYTPKTGDDYELTAGADTSAGTVTSFSSGNLTLKPSNSVITFTATVSGTALTAVTGTVTLTNNTTQTGPGELEPDTSVVTPPDTSVVTPPDTSVVTPPDTSVVTPPDTSVVTPPDTSVVTPPDTSVVTPPDTSVVTPPDTSIVTPPDTSVVTPPDTSVVDTLGFVPIQILPNNVYVCSVETYRNHRKMETLIERRKLKPECHRIRRDIAIMS